MRCRCRRLWLGQWRVLRRDIAAADTLRPRTPGDLAVVLYNTCAVLERKPCMQPSDLVETYVSQGQLAQAMKLWLLISCCGLQSADAVAALHVTMCSAVLASITAHPQDR